MASVSSESYSGRYFKFTVTQSGTSTTVSWKFEVLGGSSPYYSTSPINCYINGKNVYSVGETSYSTGAFPAAKGSKSGTYNIGSYGTFTITLSGRPYYASATSKSTTITLTKPTYTVTYNANGGTGAPSSQTKTYGTALTLSSTVPTRTGYTFTGWNTATDGSGTAYAAGASYTTNAALTLYAQWELITYTVSYDANGGTGAPDSQEKTHGTSLTLSSVIPTKDSEVVDGATVNYIFNGWDTSSTATTASYLAGSSYTEDASITLYAVWSSTEIYTIAYNSNGGSSVPSQNKGVDESVTLSDVIPTKDGFTFVGWGTSIDDTLASYMPGDAYSANESITLYAIWTPWEHTIEFNANGGTGDVPESITKIAGVDQIIPETKPVRNGYAFKSWNTESDGSGTDYYIGEGYSYDQDGGTVVLYAVWIITDILIYKDHIDLIKTNINGDLSVLGDVSFNKPLGLENGGIGASTIKDARQKLNYLGINPIASADDDTPANWLALGTGHAYISGSGKLSGQPVAYGLIESIVVSSTVFQTFISWTTGSTRRKWTRSGQTTWSNWLMTIDENNILDATYPVGAVYISYVSTSPAELFGGTWVAMTGVFPYFNAGTATGGSNTHTLTTAEMPAHTHTGSSNSTGAHTHGVQGYERTTYSSSGARTVSYVKLSADAASSSTPVLSAGGHSHTITIGSTGSGGAHNNMPAYQTLYAWRRTA